MNVRRQTQDLPWRRRLPPSASTRQSCSCEPAPHERTVGHGDRHCAALPESFHQTHVQRKTILKGRREREKKKREEETKRERKRKRRGKGEERERKEKEDIVSNI